MPVSLFDLEDRFSVPTWFQGWRRAQPRSRLAGRGVASAMLSFVYIAIIVVSGLLAYFLPQLIPNLPCDVFYSSCDAEYHIFIFPVIFAVVLISFIKRVIRIIVTSMQATYFSVFYTLINKPSELSPEMKQKVVEYLKA